MRKITFFIPNLHVGGAEKVTVTLANYFSQSNSVEVVVLNDSGELKSELSGDIKVMSLNVKSMKIELFGLLKLIKYLKESKPEGLVCVMWPLTIVGVLANLLSGSNSKVIVTDHTTFSRTKWVKNRFKKFIFSFSVFLFYRFSKHQVMVSNSAARDLENLACLQKNSIKTIYNPIPTRGNRTISRKGSVKRIITVGSLKWAKNHELLINAFKIVNKQLVDVELVIVGEGERREELEGLVKNLGLEHCITFTGLQTGKALEDLYLNSTLFVLSSHYEGFSMVIAEALSFGLPVVSVDCDFGPREIINHSDLGMLVPPDDEYALAKSIVEGLHHNFDEKKLKERAEFFSVEKIGNQYLELFN